MIRISVIAFSKYSLLNTRREGSSCIVLFLPNTLRGFTRNRPRRSLSVFGLRVIVQEEQAVTSPGSHESPKTSRRPPSRWQSARAPVAPPLAATAQLAQKLMSFKAVENSSAHVKLPVIFTSRLLEGKADLWTEFPYLIHGCRDPHAQMEEEY